MLHFSSHDLLLDYADRVARYHLPRGWCLVPLPEKRYFSGSTFLPFLQNYSVWKGPINQLFSLDCLLLSLDLYTHKKQVVSFPSMTNFSSFCWDLEGLYVDLCLDYSAFVARKMFPVSKQMILDMDGYPRSIQTYCIFAFILPVTKIAW